jgi:hypothetical protein
VDLRKPIEFLHPLATDKQRPHLLYVGAMNPIVWIEEHLSVSANHAEHTFAGEEGPRGSAAHRAPQGAALPGHGGAASSCNCEKYDRRCFYFGYLVCAPARAFFGTESCILQYVAAVVRVAARLDIALEIRLIDAS